MQPDRVEKDRVLAAEVKPSAENALFLRVVWVRPPYRREARR